MFSKFEHYDLAISEVSHYGFSKGHSSIKLAPKGPRVFWCKTTQKYLLLKKEPVILF
jgi:hypothetical protein